MAVNKINFQLIKKQLDEKQVCLIAVSKTKPVSAIQELYNLGHRDFGENYVQELADKETQLPKDIRWHFIGHLQTNKVKLIAPFVQLIHGVDSLKILKEINKQAEKNNRVIDCLLQVHIAQEETKFGLDEKELHYVINEYEKSEMKNARVCGLMGMASFSTDMQKVKVEFEHLKRLFDAVPAFTTLSMGMSSDYETAIEAGSTMVRIGSLLFGDRVKK
ncbi:MAG: YggS family pyridoxal phosphate-dependent enzyme [Chitinophagaceae bacterium]